MQLAAESPNEKPRCGTGAVAVAATQNRNATREFIKTVTAEARSAALPPCNEKLLNGSREMNQRAMTQFRRESQAK
jgi:hypothetical protein